MLLSEVPEDCIEWGGLGWGVGGGDGIGVGGVCV